MTAIAFDCGACVEYLPGQTVQDVLDDHYATCRLCLSPEVQEWIDYLHGHRTQEEIDARCGEIFRLCDIQERAKDDPDYALPISGDILTKLRSDK